MKPTKALTIVCLILGIIIGLIGTINGIMTLIYVISYSLTQLIVSSIIDLVLSVSILVFSIIYLLKVAAKGQDQIQSVPSILSLYFTSGVCATILLLFYMPNEALGAIITVLVLFLCAAILLIVGANIFKKAPKGGAITSLIGFFVSLIITIMSMFGFNTSSNSPLTILVAVLVLIYCILGVILFIIYLAKSNEPSPVTSVASSYQYKPVEKDAAEQLQKLKDLHEQGILSDEEYEEKRRKYIEKL